MTEDINSNPENRNVKIQNINIAVFSSDDYIRNSFAKENATNFTEIYNGIKYFLEKKLAETNNQNREDIKSKIIFIVNNIIRFMKVIIRIYGFLVNIFYKSKKVIKFFNFKRIFFKKY